jgi:uncharacterized protein VcgC/VcgE DUF2780
MRRTRFAIATLALLMLSTAGIARGAEAQAQQQAAAAAAEASPDLVADLSTELSATPEQAAGAAGALFGVAKSRMKTEDFAQVSNAVPGMASLLAAAPALTAATGTAGALSQLGGSAGTLVAAASAFKSLGLPPELVSKALPVIIGFVTKSGGANTGNLLAGALK